MSRNAGGFRDWAMGKGYKFKDPSGNIFGRGSKKDSLENSVNSSAPKLESRGPKFIEAEPEFLGGQVAGVAYRYRVRYDIYSNGNPWQLNRRSNEEIGLGPIVGFRIGGEGRDAYIEVVETAVNGSLKYQPINSGNYSGITFENPRFEYLERTDGTSQEDDINEGGNVSSGDFEPAIRVGTVNLTLPPGYVPPPPIKISDVTITLLGPGGFFVDPIPTSIPVGKPPPVTSPEPTTSPILEPSTSPEPATPPSNSPVLTPVPVSVPFPSTNPVGGAFENPVTPTTTATNTGIAPSTAPSTAPVVAPSPLANPLPNSIPSTVPPDAPPDAPSPSPTMSPVGEPLAPIIRPTIRAGGQGKLSTQTFSPSPPVPPSAGGTGSCSSCSKEIGAKVDNLGNALGIVNAAGQAVDLTLLNVINAKLGNQVPGGISGWLGRFSNSLKLDRALNVLSNLLVIHNAMQLSRNLGDSISYLLNSGLEAIGLRDEDDTPININQMIGGSIGSFVQSIVGAEAYQGLSTAWKKSSAIYTAVIQTYELTLNALAGIAEGLELASQYTGKIGNALLKAGTVLGGAYQWMDENFRVKTGRLGKVQGVIDGIQNTEEVVSNLTQITEQVKETQENINEIGNQFETIKTQVKDNEDDKQESEESAKENSQSPNIQTSDLNKPT